MWKLVPAAGPARGKDRRWKRGGPISREQLRRARGLRSALPVRRHLFRRLPAASGRALRGGGSRWPLGIMRRGGLLEVALGFTVLLASYTSHGADTNLEAGNVKETRANRAKRRGGGGHDALKG